MEREKRLVIDRVWEQDLMTLIHAQGIVEKYGFKSITLGILVQKLKQQLKD